MKNRVLFVILIIFAFLPNYSASETDPVTLLWEKFFDTSNNEIGKFVIYTPNDRGFLIGGDSSIDPGNKMLLIKTDSEGNHKWNKTYAPAGTNFETDLYDLISTSDGGFAFIGFLRNTSGSEDIFLVKTDSSGSVEWERSFDGNENKFDFPVSLIQSEDEGYMIAGGEGVTIGGSYDYWLIKTNSTGSIQWEENFNNAHDPPTSLIKTKNGDFLFTGITKVNDEPFKIWSIMVNENGEMVWDKFYSHEKSLDLNFGKGLIQTSDEGFAYAAVTFDEPWQSFIFSAKDIYLLKTDKNGEKEWDLTYGGDYRDYPTSITETSNNELLISGSYSYNEWSDIPDVDMWLLKFDNSGNKIWEYTYGEDGKEDIIQDILVNEDSLFAVGYTESFGVQNGAIWFGKYSLKENENPTSIAFPTISAIAVSMTIYSIKKLKIRKNVK